MKRTRSCQILVSSSVSASKVSRNDAYCASAELRTRYDNGDDPNDPMGGQGGPGGGFQGHPGGFGGGGGFHQFFQSQGGQGGQQQFFFRDGF